MADIRQILFEISYQEVSTANFFNYSFGVWYKRLYLDESRLFYDAFGNTGYYDYQFSELQNVLTVQVDGFAYTPADTLNDCLALESSIYWDGNEQLLYIHFENHERPLNKDLQIDFIEGFANNHNDTTDNVYGGVYYKPLLKSIPKLKNSFDPLEFGILKYNSAKVGLENSEGEFDNWRNRKIFNTPARMKGAENPTSYSDFEEIYNGFISNDSATHEIFGVSLDDPRKNLDQPIANNLITSTLFPSAPDGSIDKLKQTTYGKLFYRKCICVDDSASAQFVFCDTEYNTPASLDAVYIDGVAQSLDSTDLTTGTFYLTTSDIDNVYASFTMSISNGVSIIKDLMLRYADLLYLGTFWDISEVDYAETRCRNTSVYIDKDSALKKTIQKICSDCDLRFFVKNNGKYTIRIYESNRQPTATIYFDDWATSQADKSNDGEKYLTSTTIEYMYRDDKGEFTRRYVNNDNKETIFGEYKKLKPKTYETGLYEESAAIDKSETIMDLRSSVSDIVKRSVNWSFKALELGDFVKAAPFSRCCMSSAESMSIWEIVDIQKDVEVPDIGLSMREVRAVPKIYDGSFYTNGSSKYITQSFTNGENGYSRPFSITREES